MELNFWRKSDGILAQLVEQRTENPCVPRSIRGDATMMMYVKNKGYKKLMPLVLFSASYYKKKRHNLDRFNLFEEIYIDLIFISKVSFSSFLEIHRLLLYRNIYHLINFVNIQFVKKIM